MTFNITPAQSNHLPSHPDLRSIPETRCNHRPTSQAFTRFGITTSPVLSITSGPVLSTEQCWTCPKSGPLRLGPIWPLESQNSTRKCFMDYPPSLLLTKLKQGWDYPQHHSLKRWLKFEQARFRALNLDCTKIWTRLSWTTPVLSPTHLSQSLTCLDH